MRLGIIALIGILFFACKADKKVDTFKGTGDSILDQMTRDILDKPENPTLYHTRAKYLYEVENYDQALADIHQAILLDSLNPDYYHLTSDIFLDYFKSDKALKAMEKVVNLYPKRIPSLLKYAELLLILKQYDPSIKTVNEILFIDPLNADGYLLLGLNFMELGETKKAINSCQTAVENDPELIEAWLILGNLYEDQKDTRAIDFYNSAVAVAPENINALHSKAYYLQNHGKIEDAINIYDQINVIDMQYKEAHLNKGILFLELKNIDRAYEEFNILCKLHPTYHLGFYYRGIVHEMKKEVDRAKIDYQNAINLKSDYTKALDALKRLQ